MQIIHETERHLLQSRKEENDDDDEDEDERGSSKEGKAKVIAKLIRLLVLTCSHGRVSLENIRRGLIVA